MLRLLAFIFFLSLPVLAGYEKISRDNGNIFFALDTVELYMFKEAEMKIIVLDANKRDIKESLEMHGCVAGINASYFGRDAARSPLGIMRHKGKTLAGRLESGRFTVSGLLYDTGKRIHLQRSSLAHPALSELREAVQAGPFLIEQGEVTGGLSRHGKSRRSFIATDGLGKWCIGVSSPLSLHELASWLKSEDFAETFTVKTALNLDGGSSSFFYTETPRRFQPPLKKIRSFIGIAPRNKE